MKKEIDPERLMRESELINQLRKVGGEKGAEMGKEFLELNDLEQVFALLAMGVRTLTGEHISPLSLAFPVTFLSNTLDEEQKETLTFALGSFIHAIDKKLSKFKEEN